MARTEKDTYEEKSKFYQSKKELLEERISILKDRITDNKEQDFLKQNSYKIEILDLEASLEDINSYWNHYMDRLMAIKNKEEMDTKECEENFKRYYDIFVAVSPAMLKQFTFQTQELYNKIATMIDKTWEQPEKNALYFLMKDVLHKMKKI